MRQECNVIDQTDLEIDKADVELVLGRKKLPNYSRKDPSGRSTWRIS
jgi:hypothetical protein